MTALGFHSTTSMAVKAVVSEVKKRLATRFNSLPNIPDFFYDFDKGLSEQFKQYYAKIPVQDRQNTWIALSYSYDSATRSSIQPRRGFSIKRPVTNILTREISAECVELPVLFSILTNDSKALNGIANFIGQKLDWSFTAQYEDLLWPEWLPGQNYPLGWYVRPTNPNGCIYMCTTPGTSAESEPDWTTEFNSIQQDNTVEWKCLQPDVLKVKAGSFVKNDTTIQNPIENGIMYQFDFGYTLSYVDYDDSGSLIGYITQADLTLLNWYREGLFTETISVPD